jgi:hypothetical protein
MISGMSTSAIYITCAATLTASIPDDKVLAVIELATSSAAAGSAKTTINTAQTAFRDTNLGRVAKSRALTRGVMAMADDLDTVISTRCVSSQDIRGGIIKVDTSRVARFITAAVSPDSCTSNTSGTIKFNTSIFNRTGGDDFWVHVE